jgi:Tfp pilus assembly protein PilF
MNRLPPWTASLTVALMLRWSWRVTLLTAAALSWGANVRAQGDDAVARSNALFEDGKRLLAEGHVAEACDKLAESNRLAARGGTLLNLGLCHEQQGKLLAARRELRDALALAKRDARADRVPVATEHLAAVEARLSYLTLVPPPNVRAEAVELRVDDALIAQREWSAVAVEAGRHVIVASAMGFRPREVVVTIRDGASQKMTTTLEALAPEGAVAAPPKPPAATAPAPATTTASMPAPHDRSSLRTAALVAGVSGFVVSLATGAWALERKGVVRAHCSADTKLCDSQGSDAASLGRALVLTSTVAFAIGAVGVGAWFFWPDAPAPSGGARGAGFAVGGTF